MDYELLTTGICKQYERLLEMRRPWEAEWNDLADYIMPRKSNVYVQRIAGAKKTSKLFDSTAPNANELLAASMQGSLTSPVIQWFSLKTTSEALNNIQPVKFWLFTVAKEIYLALSQSNFSSEIFEVYLDLGCFGTGCLYTEEVDGPLSYNGIVFDALDVAEYVIEEDKYGKVNTVYRCFYFTATNAADIFGIENLSDTIQKAAKEDPYKRFEFLQAIKPRGEYDRKRSKSSLPIASYWIEKDKKKLVQEKGYHEFPVVVPRWSKASQETYGRGPGHTALPDIKSLNEARRLALRAWGKAIDPPVIALDDGVIGSIRLTPGGINVVRQMDALDTLRNEGRFDIGNLEEEKLKESIRRIYYTDQLQLNQGGPQMTATEVQIRFELMQRLLGPTFGRLMTEMLAPMIDRVFGILYRAGKLPPPPEELLDSESGIEIEFEGPLAKAQRSGDITALERWQQVNAPLGQIDVSLYDNLDPDEVARGTAHITGLPPNWIRSVEDREEIREQRQQQQAQQQQMAAAGAMAEGMGKAAPMVKASADPNVQQQLKEILGG
jgi:hypothetical protein